MNAKRRKIKNINENETNKNVDSENGRMNHIFFNQPCLILAKSLLGKLLVRKLDCGTIIKGKIVETECYLGGEDKGSYSYNGRRTPACEPMYMEPGTAFIYMTYGMYHCFNISSDGYGAAVLLRALEPLEGVDLMQLQRKTKKRTKDLKVHELCNGPSKLCLSLQITKLAHNKLNLADNEVMWIEDNPEVESSQIVTSTRIGISSVGEEWALKPLRFYILGNTSVSKRDKIAEETILERST